MNLLNILSFILAVICYGIRELYYHGKLKWQHSNAGFWGFHSSIRKYKYIAGVIQPAPNTFYYRFLKIKYKERFPLAASLLVSFTDGPHLMQLFFKLFLILTLVTYEPIFNMVWDFIIYFLLFGLTFTITYKFLSK